MLQEPADQQWCWMGQLGRVLYVVDRVLRVRESMLQTKRALSNRPDLARLVAQSLQSVLRQDAASTQADLFLDDAFQGAGAQHAAELQPSLRLVGSGRQKASATAAAMTVRSAADMGQVGMQPFRGACWDGVDTMKSSKDTS